MSRPKQILRVGYAVIFRLYGAIAILAVATAVTLALAPILKRPIETLVGTNYVIVVWFLSLCLTLMVVFLVVFVIRKALNILRKN